MEARRLDQLPAILRDAVLSHLVSDVPVGVFLSGGIDSSALVAVLSHNGVRANTFSLVFQEEEFNEGQYSREVARRFGTEHQEIPVSQQDTLAVLPEALCAMDQPTIDGINTYLVSAENEGGGSESCSNWSGRRRDVRGLLEFSPRAEDGSFFQTIWTTAETGAAAAFRVPSRCLQAKGIAAASWPSWPRPMIPLFIRIFWCACCLGRRSANSCSHRRTTRHCNNPSIECCKSRSLQSQSLDPVNRVSYLESHFYMRNTLLRDSDFMSMAHGLELRVPFLDRALVEACFRIPGDEKLRGNLAEEPAAGESGPGHRVAQGDRQSPEARIHTAL